MKKSLLIIIFCLIPFTVFALDQLKDSELDKVTGQFGTSAAGDAGALTAPVGDASTNAGNFTPTAEPASIAVNGIIEGAYANDRSNDVTQFTTYFVNQQGVLNAVTLGFF